MHTEESLGNGDLRAPFPWYGGKSRAAPLIWQALGNVPNLVEPFAGSLAVLLGRPHAPGIETVNDKDALLCNVWRALQADPEGVAQWCDWPPNEAQLHAVHTWLVAQRATFTSRLMGNPLYYDVQVAGWWLYGICCWIGSGWCSGQGSWQSIDGKLVHLGNTGQGVRRKLVHLGNTGQGVHRQREGLYAWFAALQARLRYVRVCCGDWTRVLGPSPTTKLGLTGIYFDPPYPTEADRTIQLYREEDGQVAHAVEAWCAAHGDDPLLRLVLCGYGSTHDALLSKGWARVEWKANGGYGNQGQGRGRANKTREVLWLSPHCLTITQQLGLFGEG